MRLVGLTGIFLAATFVISGCAEQRLTANNTLALTEANFEVGERVGQSHFSLKDEVRVATFVTWPNPSQGDGLHDVIWNWYKDDTLVSRTRRDGLDFESTPYELWSKRVAAGLGPGHFRVDVVVDGATMASVHFTIDPA